MIFYRYLYRNMRELSPNEGLVYSALLSHSLMGVPEHFDVDGGFSVENVKAFIESNFDEYGVEGIEYSPISTRRLAKMLSMSENTVRRIKEDLEHKHHLVDYEIIACPPDLLDMGYIDLPSTTGLKGLQLIFYGLLRDRSTMYHGVIDTWAKRLAEIMGTEKGNVYDLLYALHKKGYVERLDDGRLRIR